MNEQLFNCWSCSCWRHIALASNFIHRTKIFYATFFHFSCTTQKSNVLLAARTGLKMISRNKVLPAFIQSSYSPSRVLNFRVSPLRLPSPPLWKVAARSMQTASSSRTRVCRRKNWEAKTGTKKNWEIGRTSDERMQKASEERGSFFSSFFFCFVLTSCCDNCKYVSEAFLSFPKPDNAC